MSPHHLPSDSVSGDGFTGVEWTHRSTEQLRTDLFDGAGPAPAGELGAAWLSTAIELDALAVELRAVLLVLRSDIVISASPLLADRGNQLANWLESVATYARSIADHAFSHASAVTRARAAMPSAAELSAMNEAIAALAQFGPGIAGLFAGMHNAVNQAHSDAERTAAAVMRVYEQQTAGLVAADDEIASPPRLTAPAVTTDHSAPTPHTQQPQRSAQHAPQPTVQAPTTAMGMVTPTAAPAAAAGPRSGAGRGARPRYETAQAQVRPAAVVHPAGVGHGAPTAQTLNLVSEQTASSSAKTAGAVPPAAPLGQSASPVRGADSTVNAASSSPVPGVSVRARELYGLDIAVAPTVIGEAHHGGAA